MAVPPYMRARLQGHYEKEGTDKEVLAQRASDAFVGEAYGGPAGVADQQETDFSIKLQLKMLAATQAAHGKQHILYAEGLKDLASLYQEIQKTQEALKYYREAEDVYRRLGLIKDPNLQACVERIKLLATRHKY